MIGYAICASFCTFRQSLAALRSLALLGADILPIMSENAYSTSSRFFDAESFSKEVREICKRDRNF